jgi:iron complex outermembrane receptor protein
LSASHRLPPLRQLSERHIIGRQNRIFLWLLAGIATGAQISPSRAQSQAPDASQNLDEIVVTAERRESTVQKTPFSITAISGEQIAAQGLQGIKDIAVETVGIQMRSAGPGQTEYDMRGLTSGGGASPTVGLYLNDVPLASPAASFTGHVSIDPDLFDLNRVEVLRGPQGTLFGSGSMGGTIRLVTNDPVMNKFEGSAETIISHTQGGGPNYGVNAMVNLPLVDDHLALRIVGTDKYMDGWINRIVVNPFPLGSPGACGFTSCTRGNVTAAPVTSVTPRSNSERLTGGRGSLLFKPTDDLSIELMAMYQKISMAGFSQADDPPGPDALAHYQPFNMQEPFEDIFRIYSLTINYDLGFAKLTSDSSSWRRDSVWTGDVAENFQNLLSSFYGFAPLISIPYYNDDPSQQVSEELRLTSEGDGKFQWVLGGFYDRFKSQFIQYIANPAYGAISTGGPAANPLGILYSPNEPYHINQSAAFAEASYAITDTLKGTVGARWYKYNSEQTVDQSGVLTLSGNATPSFADVKARDSGINPKMNLSYRPNSELTLYAQAAKGFRPGGVNIPAPSTCTVQPGPSYSPDSIWNYEVGEKARFWEGRLTVNADVYYIIWKNIQEQLNQTCGFPYTANAGTAVSYGPELELSAKLTDHFTASLSGTYTQAYLKDVSAGAVGTIGSTTALTPGLRLDNVPHYTINATASYAFPVTDTYKVLARIDGTVTGPQYDISYYTERLPGYTMLNTRIGLLGGALVPYLFVDNLTNKHAAVTIDTQEWSIAMPSFSRDAITTPRTVGIDLQYKF